MVSIGMRASAPSTSSTTTSPSTDAMAPVQLPRPSTGCVLSTAVSPTNRAKCSAVRSGRSMPGDDTSSVYAPGNGSSSSMRSLIHACAEDSSSKLTPSGVSMYTRIVGAFFAPATSTVTISTPSCSARGANASSSCCSFLLSTRLLLPVWFRFAAPCSHAAERRALTNKESGNKPTFSCVESMVRENALASLSCRVFIPYRQRFA